MDDPAEKAYAQYKGLIRSLIHSIVVNNPSVVDNQDLQQAGAEALIAALQDESYDPSLGSFSSYIRKCIRNALLEQANSFNKVFTVDEKVRRQANLLVKLRAKGLDDDAVMARLGIKTRATLLSLEGLVNNHPVDLDQIEVEADAPFDRKHIFSMLDEIGLSKQEVEFVDLATKNHSMDDIMSGMSLSRSSLYTIKASIRDKILAWGRDN